ncbi:MAG: hypothetical protein WBV28_04090, partial [Terracidiphilus sp.]
LLAPASASLVGSISFASEVSLLLLVPTFTVPNQMCERNRTLSILAAAAMNFQKLLRAFRRTILYCLMQLWNGLIDLKDPRNRNTQLQYV